MTKRCCANCLIYQYQDEMLKSPFNINTQKEKNWDMVLTIACRTCTYNNYPHFCDPALHGDKINDVFIKKLEMQLKNNLGIIEYRKEQERMKEEKEWMKHI